MAKVKPGTLTLAIRDLPERSVVRLKRILWEDSDKPDGLDGCWYPKTYRMSNGYATVGWDTNKRLAHRVSYALFHGETPGDMLVTHRCDHRGCSAPHHLALGTASDNTVDMVSKDRHRMHTSTKRRVLNAALVSEMRRRNRAGESQIQLARELGISDRTLNSALREGGRWSWVPDDVPPEMATWRKPHGEGHANSKLTEDDIRAIRAAYAISPNASELARVFSVSPPTISLIVRRESWGHVA